MFCNYARAEIEQSNQKGPGHVVIKNSLNAGEQRTRFPGRFTGSSRSRASRAGGSAGRSTDSKREASFVGTRESYPFQFCKAIRAPIRAEVSRALGVPGDGVARHIL